MRYTRYLNKVRKNATQKVTDNSQTVIAWALTHHMEYTGAQCNIGIDIWYSNTNEYQINTSTVGC